MRRQTRGRRAGRLAATFVLVLVGLSPVLVFRPAVAEPGRCDVKAGADADDVVPWPQTRLDFDRVHRFATGAGITVAVIDSGLTQDQPQVAKIAVRSPTNVMGAPYAPTDVRDCEDYGHGTRVAALIAAPQVPGVGFMGLAPEATIMPIKYRDSSTQDVGGDSAAVARGIDAAVAAGVDVINLSLQAPDTAELRAAMTRAAQADIVVVAASGNDTGEGVPEPYPGKYAEEEAFSHVLAVGATDDSDAVAGFSVTGAQLGVAAPGVQILAPTQLQGFYAEDGTSFAAPLVSATAALVRQAHPALSAAEVVTRIEATADSPGVDVPSDAYGWGVLDPYVAVTAERSDAKRQPERSSTPAAPAPRLPTPPDHRLRDLGLLLSAGLLGWALLVAVAAAAIRHARTRPPSVADSV